MVFKRRRIETHEAQVLRSDRQEFAAPGGSHDRLVKFLATALPMAVGVVAALMIITPLSPRGEVSFLLDRKKAEVIDERLRADRALYRGQDDKGRPFSLTAGEAVQRSSTEGIVRMRDLAARLLLPEGPAQLLAAAGEYNLNSDRVDIPDTVRFTAADGYAMQVQGVTVDLARRMLVGEGGVSGDVPAGSFSADRLEANLDARTVSLVGNARLRMIPGRVNQMRIPQ